MPDEETITMLRDYMEKGLLENIEAMFRQDPSLWAAVPEMITDERSRVRIGTIALAETMAPKQSEDAALALEGIAEGLSHVEPTIRGDVIFLMESMGLPEAMPYLERALDKEEHPVVCEALEDAIRELERGQDDV